MRNFRQLQYNASMQSALEIAKSWLDAKPDNPQLKELVKCLTDVYLYVNSLEIERKGFDSVVDNLQEQRLELAKQAQVLEQRDADNTVAKKFERELSDDINERLNNIL